MITLGVDLSSHSGNTALAAVDWSTSSPRAVEVASGVDDEMIVEVARTADVVAIGAPFGWPDGFHEVLTQHRLGGIAEPRRLATVSGRDEIMYRLTERRVREWMGLKLMASTANMLGTTTLRCAGLLARLQAEGIAPSRAGGGRVVEAYPPASLMAWGLHEANYKQKPAIRARILEQIGRRLWLDLREHGLLCVESDDALDALIMSLTARAVARGLWRRPDGDDEARRAQTEGWMCVPTGPIEQLREEPASPTGFDDAPNASAPPLVTET